ncbi:MAG: glutamine--fructose-6-phosphate transaminase (isomerizing) [Candidatus Aenigmatarchaeota archaeon]
MCGIAGYVGKDQAAPILLNALKRLEYRGYDSCGILTVSDRTMHHKKDAGKVSDVDKKHGFAELPGTFGIAHTRWATHGEPSQRNAHPHFDCNHNIGIVHNGIISNYLQLKKDLESRGHAFKSDTDSEVFAHLVEEKYRGNLEIAVREAVKYVHGTYAFLVVSKSEEKIVCVRKENPLIIGIGNGSYYVGSDLSAFIDYTNIAIPLDDNELAILTTKGYQLMTLDGSLKEKEIIKIDWDANSLTKSGYAHYMLKEICEQPITIKIAKGIHADKIQALSEMIGKYDKVYITATGTSLYAAMVAEYWFAQIAKKDVRVVDSSEFPQKAVIDENSLVIAMTQSGETYDTLSAIRFAKSQKAKLAAIVNVIGSSATREAEITIMQGAGLESAVCATKTFTSQLMILLRLALGVAKLRGIDVSYIENEVELIPKHAAKIIDGKDKIKEIAEKNFDVKNYLYIGRGICYPIALEGALKMKEVSYLHAEGMAGGFLKHGTISLIDKHFHMVAMIPRDDRKILSNVEEIKARNGFVVGISSGMTVHADVPIEVPETGDLVTPILFSIVCQLLAYYVAVKLGNDVDRPRSLAKSVTVE